LFFIAGILLLVGLFTIKLTTEGLENMFFITGILLLKGSLYWGFSVVMYDCNNQNVWCAGMCALLWWLVTFVNLIFFCRVVNVLKSLIFIKLAWLFLYAPMPMPAIVLLGDVVSRFLLDFRHERVHIYHCQNFSVLAQTV